MKSVGFLFIIIVVTFGYTQAPDTLWTKTYGGIDDDGGSYVQQTNDGGYIIVGTKSDSLWLIKTNVSGDSIWSKTYRIFDWVGCGANSVQQTFDDGYIIAAWFVVMPLGGSGMLIKTDALGDTVWTLGDPPRVNCVKQTSDSGYIAVGGSGYLDMFAYLVKTDMQGNIVWTKYYGNINEHSNCLYSFQQTTDGNFIIVGTRDAFGTHIPDVWLLKIDTNGDTLWTKTYGGINEDYGHSVQQTSGGGYIIAGHTWSFGAGSDLYLIRTDDNGNTLWTRNYGGQDFDGGSFIDLAHDSGYVITGVTSSYGAGANDLWFMKVKPDGDTLWTTTYGGTVNDVGNCVQHTNDGGYVIVGRTGSFGAGSDDMWLIKTEPDVGIAEGETEIVTQNDIITTIFRGPLQLPQDRKCKVFDITGRVVAPDKMRPGIYFIEVDGQIVQKVVKVR